MQASIDMYGSINPCHVETWYILIIVFPGLKWPPFFANYSLMVILIEK